MQSFLEQEMDKFNARYGYADATGAVPAATGAVGGSSKAQPAPLLLPPMAVFAVAPPDSERTPPSARASAVMQLTTRPPTPEPSETSSSDESSSDEPPPPAQPLPEFDRRLAAYVRIQQQMQAAQPAAVSRAGPHPAMRTGWFNYCK